MRLKPAHLLCDRTLGNTQFICGGSEVQVPPGGFEGSQAIERWEFHRRYSRFSIFTEQNAEFKEAKKAAEKAANYGDQTLKASSSSSELDLESDPVPPVDDAGGSLGAVAAEEEAPPSGVETIVATPTLAPDHIGGDDGAGEA